MADTKVEKRSPAKWFREARAEFKKSHMAYSETDVS
jgi:hypothetical protein